MIRLKQCGRVPIPVTDSFFVHLFIWTETRADFDLAECIFFPSFFFLWKERAHDK